MGDRQRKTATDHFLAACAVFRDFVISWNRNDARSFWSHRRPNISFYTNTGRVPCLRKNTPGLNRWGGRRNLGRQYGPVTVDMEHWCLRFIQMAWSISVLSAIQRPFLFYGRAVCFRQECPDAPGGPPERTRLYASGDLSPT